MDAEGRVLNETSLAAYEKGRSSILNSSSFQQGGRLLSIRLARAGTRKKVSYRVVVIDKQRARDGRFVEIVGLYNPRREPPELVLNRDRVAYWMKAGAQPSDTVRSLLKGAPESAAVSI